MLSGHLSNQDEEEVEDELEALHRDMAPQVPLPEVPKADLVEHVPEPEPPGERVKPQAETRTPLAA